MICMQGHRAVAGAIFMAVLAIIALAPAPALATGPGGARAEVDHCLSCHGRHGMTMTFLDGQTVPAFVNQAGYRSSVHGLLACGTCHDGFTFQEHPKKKYRTRQHYSTRMSRKCRSCHADKSIFNVPVHADLMEKEKGGSPPLCQDCHGAHDTRKLNKGRAYEPEEKYCLGCHGHDIKTTFINGKEFRLHIDSGDLRGSVHSELNCSDCHFGFTEEEHPQRSFKNSRQFSLALSEMCKRCHFDKYARIFESIHYKLLSTGRRDAPNCTDCHGAHGIKKTSGDKLESARRCAACHESKYETYKESVHGSALIGQGNPDVPVCIDCHTSHDIVDPMSAAYHDRIPSMCSGCHADGKVMGKYGLSTDVVKTYLSDFHGVTLSFYRQQDDERYAPNRAMAECTDCHGTHDITGNFGSNAKTVKRNLVRRCRTCHEDAGENFPDAWLSHYRPSMAHAPLVFIVDAVYKVALPLIVIGLLVQVLLHLWRYFSSR
jgi:hypothetical protein